MSTEHWILLSGGLGARVGAGRPKQFLELGGKAVLLHSVETIRQTAPRARLLLVAPASFIEESARITVGLVDSVVAGGDSRHQSSLAGLAALPLEAVADSDAVFFHDVARPLVTAAEIDRLRQALGRSPDGLASLVGPVTETVVEGDGLEGTMLRPLDRSRLFAVKTPQAAFAGTLRRMITEAPLADYTDLLTWAYAAGRHGGLAAASERNLKLTSPGDLSLLESMLQKTNAR